MTDTPQTATEIMMLDMEDRRIEARDRQVAISVARKVIDERFSPEKIEDMGDVRRQMIMAAEFAAYDAIQKERELHAGDMAALRSWSDVRWAEAMLKPPAAIAMEVRQGGDGETRLHAEHDSAGLNEASPNPSQDTSPSSKDET